MTWNIFRCNLEMFAWPTWGAMSVYSTRWTLGRARRASKSPSTGKYTAQGWNTWVTSLHSFLTTASGAILWPLLQGDLAVMKFLQKLGQYSRKRAGLRTSQELEMHYGLSKGMFSPRIPLESQQWPSGEREERNKAHPPPRGASQRYHWKQGQRTRLKTAPSWQKNAQS